MFQTILIQPLTNLLVIFNNWFGSLGWAIIVSTILVRVSLIPLILPQLRSGEAMKKLAPQIKKLKEKHKNSKEKLAKAQMALYKKEGINPAAGCLPTILQMAILIALFQVFQKVLSSQDQTAVQALLYKGVSLPSNGINFSFLYLNLPKPDLLSDCLRSINFGSLKNNIPGMFLILSAVFQFLTAKLTQPQVQEAEKLAEKTANKSDDMTVMMQKQMLYMMPLMTLLIGLKLPSGVTLYWFVFSLTGLIQQLAVKKLGKTRGGENEK